MSAPHTISISLSSYLVDATCMFTGKTASFEVQALDAGDALWRVERHGKWAADDARLVEEAECPNFCDDGIIWNNADPTSGQWVACDACAQGQAS